MVPFAIAGIQMNISARESNLQAMQRRLSELMSLYPWVQMVVFSELAAWGPSLTHAQPLPGPTEEAFCALASKHRIWLIPGSIYERADQHTYNTASVINPEGQVVGRYRKLFPFAPYEAGVTGGDSFLVFDVPSVGRFGVSICYDIWFPETSRALTVLGAEVILHPTWTSTIDRDIEVSQVRVTAAAHQCYVFDINGVGAGGYGRSSVCDPEGNVLYEAGSGEEMLPLEIDLEQVRRSRERGIRGLGQMLKSFRDRTVEFPIYQTGADLPYLDSLGPLAKPTRRPTNLSLHSIRGNSSGNSENNA